MSLATVSYGVGVDMAQACSRARWTPLLLLVVWPASLGCVVNIDADQYTAHEEKRFEVTGRPDVNLVTFDGSIEVRSWDRSEVLVEIEKRGADRRAVESIEVKAEQSGNRIAVEARRPGDSESFGGFQIHTSRRAKLIATVPRETNLFVRSGDGSVTVEGVSGRVELRTGDGGIRGTDIAGELYVNTGDGSVRLAGLDGRADVRTGDGGIAMEGKLTTVRARTGDGSVTVRIEPGSAMAADWTIDTGDGGVVVYLPAAFDADIDAHTGDGAVRSELDVTLEGGESSRRSLRGRLGTGGKLLKIRSGDGSIVLRAQ